MIITWKLPASKTDPSAASVTRTWGGLCSSGSVCPAHTADFHVKFMKVLLG
jgi:hypothetical protein